MKALAEEIARDLARIVQPIVREAVREAIPKEAVADRPGKNWLTNAEAMKYLGLSRPTLARYRASGKLPYAKVGASVFYHLADIEAFLEQNVNGGSAP